MIVVNTKATENIISCGIFIKLFHGIYCYAILLLIAVMELFTKPITGGYYPNRRVI